MHMCNKCTGIFTLLLVAIGVALLLQDLKVWAFWNIKWSTAIILLLAVKMIGSGHCPECKEIRKKK